MDITSATATSTAPPAAFFDRWADVETWPEWNTDTDWVRLDGPFAQGATGTMKPTGGPRMAFTVTRLDDGAFVDVTRVPGARITFDHRIRPTEAGGSAIEVQVSITGPLARVWSLVLAGGFRSTLKADLDGLVATAERHPQSA